MSEKSLSDDGRLIDRSANWTKSLAEGNSDFAILKNTVGR
jgi:hypothetical protein